MKKNPLKVIAGTTDKPLVINNFKIQCYVLEDETRVLSQRGVFSGLNITSGGSTASRGSAPEMPRFASQKWLKPFISKDLDGALKTPILFSPPTGGTAYGYPATLLVDICNAIIEADQTGATKPRQTALVQRAWKLIQGFATVGIIALVDEVTGFQSLRDKKALQAILDKYLRKEFATWAKRFPDEFYEQIFRLKSWTWKGMKINRPSIIGKYTTDIVYQRLAPNIAEELEKRNPKAQDGNRRAKHHQWLTEDIGHPALAQHLYAVVILMKSSSTWRIFYNRLQRVLPIKGEAYQFELFGDDD